MHIFNGLIYYRILKNYLHIAGITSYIDYKGVGIHISSGVCIVKHTHLIKTKIQVVEVEILYNMFLITFVNNEIL